VNRLPVETQRQQDSLGYNPDPLMELVHGNSENDAGMRGHFEEHRAIGCFQLEERFPGPQPQRRKGVRFGNPCRLCEPCRAQKQGNEDQDADDGTLEICCSHLLNSLFMGFFYEDSHI